MAIIRKPEPGDIKAAKLRQIYLKAENDIIRELTRKRNLGLVDYSEVAALNRVQEILKNMQDEANEYIPQMVAEKFYTANDLPSAPYGYYNAEALTSTQTAIVEQLVDNLSLDISDAAKIAEKSASEFLALGRLEADKFRNLTLEMVASLEAQGKGWNTIQNQMAAKLQAQGITCFVDKAGRKWGLTQYCSMATRTTQRQAQVSAALTADDWDLWQIAKIGSTCPLCSVYEGRVYSKSGTDPDYPPLTMAFGKIDPKGINDLTNSYLNIHPNCLHSLVRYTTMGKTEAQIERDKEFSSFEKRPANVDYRSKSQIEAYRQKEKERAEFRSNYKQFKKYQAALGNDFPKTYETFEKHKKLKDDVYKGWEEKFRNLSKQSAELMSEINKPVLSIENINTKATNRLKENYEQNRIKENLNLVPVNEIMPGSVGADYGDIDIRSANSFDQTIGDLMNEYETPLNKISLMEKEEAFFNQTVPASTTQQYETASSEIRLNKIVYKDYDKYIERVKEAVQKGQFPKMEAKNYEKYVPTHEFTHTLMAMQTPIPTKRNWTKKDFSGISKAKKEVQNIFDKYKSEYTSLNNKRKALELKYLDGSISEKEIEELKGLTEAVNNIKISNRSFVDVDEFFAEAFTDAKIGSSPSPYAQDILSVIEKYFGKSTGKTVELLGKGGIIKGTETSKINHQFFAKVPEEKLSSYALDFNRQPDKAKAFKEALGYTKENSGELKVAIETAFDESKLKYKGANQYGDLYEQVTELVGPNGKKANVLSAWIKKPDEDYSLTSVYVTKKKVT